MFYLNPIGDARRFSDAPQLKRQQYCRVANKDDPTSSFASIEGLINGDRLRLVDSTWEDREVSGQIGNCFSKS